MTSLLERYTAEELKTLIREEATPEEVTVIQAALEDELYDWKNWARPKQLPPEGDWLIWLLVTGRRWGKTRTAAQWLRTRALETVGTYGICAPTFGDVRDVCIEGGTRSFPSGFLSVCKPSEIANYNRSLGEIRMTNGSKIHGISADEPDRGRGYGFVSVWCDEFSSWRHASMWFDILLPATTMADSHRFVITTTPKPNKLTTGIIRRAKDDPRIVFVRGHTEENSVNLGAGVVEELRRNLSARSARQELEGELLTDVPGALWTIAGIDDHRVDTTPDLVRVTTAIDPAVTSDEESDETGIVVCGKGTDGHAYVLSDRSCRLSPERWARRAVAAHDDHEGDRIVGEANNGGDLVETVLRAVEPTIPYKKVHASRGKRVRAEPIAALYEQGRVHHVSSFPELEEQMVSWTPDSGESPDRMDALVWALTDLMLEPERRRLRFRG